jgi:hypothetical protein
VIEGRWVGYGQLRTEGAGYELMRLFPYVGGSGDVLRDTPHKRQ